MLVGLDGRKKALFFDQDEVRALLKKRANPSTVSMREIEALSKELHAALYPAHKLKPIPDVKKDMSPYQDISTFDLLMLKLLYCKSLHAGMDRAKAAEVLMTEDACWQ